jgi:hypothetical protein
VLKRADIIKKVLHKTNRFIWQRSKKYIYPAKEIIFACYYIRNETETVLAGKLKQAVNAYYPSRIYGIRLYIFRQY